MKENNSLMGWNPPKLEREDKPKNESGTGRPQNQGGDDNDIWTRHHNRSNGDQGMSNMLKKKSKELFGGYKNGNTLKSNNSFKSILIVALVLLAGFYIFTGFYTVREAERGVVLRFGKFYDVVEPGLQWKFTGIDQVTTVDIEQVRSIQSSGSMLTEDENVVNVEMDVQYRISDPMQYLYSVTSPDNSLMEATDSALRYVVGHTLMDDILTSGRERVRQDTKDLLISIIEPYNMGLSIVDVNFLPARPPEEVKEAFDDAIAAQEDEQRFKREAEAYANEVLPKAEGQVQRIRQEAEAYRTQVVLKAQGEVARFEQILPEFNAAPEITKRRIYLDTMQEVLGKSSKIILDTPSGSNPVLYLPVPSNNNMMNVKQVSPKANTAPASLDSTVQSSSGTYYPSRSASTYNNTNNNQITPRRPAQRDSYGQGGR